MENVVARGMEDTDNEVPAGVDVGPLADSGEKFRVAFLVHSQSISTQNKTLRELGVGKIKCFEFS